jgi:alkylation response protein AidB-like acyl-CoA dehydrogenase
VYRELTGDQELLRATTIRLIESVCPVTNVRALIDDPLGFDPDYLRRGADVGWLAMLVTPEYGGASYRATA